MNETLVMILSAATIFSLRLVDVSLGALRISMLFRGRRVLAGMFGFFESLAWLVAASLVLGKLSSPLQFIAYGAGYAAGTMLGSTVERWLAIGNAMVRIVTPGGTRKLAGLLRDAGYYATTVSAQGRDGEVEVNLSVVSRRKAPQLMRMIHQAHPEAFITYDETTPYRVAARPAASVRK